MEAINNIQFWVDCLIPISILMMPILLVGKATPFRSFLAASVIYFMIIIIASCNISALP